MRDQYRLGFVDVGGWDTHVNQGSITGGLANNLRNLGEGLAAYAAALGDEKDVGRGEEGDGNVGNAPGGPLCKGNLH